MNEYFQAGSTPAPNSPGSSAVIRAQFANIAAAFDKLPTMAGNQNEIVTVNASGTALMASGYALSDILTLNGVQTMTNKTIVWANNNIDTIPIQGGGTGATTQAAAQAALGVDLKADSFNAVLTGAPTCPTPPTGDTSARIVNSYFVTNTLAAIGAATPSDAIPLVNGAASAGVNPKVSRDDHVHPSDTSRAPVSAGTAVGTSFTPAGTVAATNVQAAIAELDSETQTALSLKAPLASPALTGTPTAPTPSTSDNTTRIATTAFMQALMAQQPPVVQVSSGTPLINGVAAPGVGVDASRWDHVHPTDTTRLPVNSPSATGTFTSGGSINFTGASSRIFGDFSSASLPARLMFQNGVTNGATNVGLMPNGTATSSAINLYGRVDPANAPIGTLQLSSTELKLAADITGTGTYKPINFYTSGALQMGIATNGDITMNGVGALKVHAGTTAQRPGTPVEGHFRRNTQLKQWEGYDGANWSGIGGASGAGGNPFCYENDIIVTTSYTITTGKNAMSAGPITIANGAVVTVPHGSVWSIV